MKKNAILLFGILILSVATIKAQDYVWDFGNDRTLFPIGIEYTEDTEVAGLLICPRAETNPMQIVQKYGREQAGVPSTYKYCFSPNGSGYNGAKNTDEKPRRMTPDKRFLSFKVKENCIIKARIMAPAKGASASLFVTDGKNLLGTMTPNNEYNDVFTECTVSYSHIGEGEKTIYIFGNNNVRICYMEVKSETDGK